MRSWRHPSEIAAAAAAADRELVASPAGPSVTAAIGRVAMVGVLVAAAGVTALAVGTTMALRTGVDPSASAAGRASIFPSTPSSTLRSATLTDRENEGNASRSLSASTSTSRSSSASEQDPTKQTGDSAEAATAHGTHTETGSELPDTGFDPTELMEAADGDGVYGRVDGRVERLASFTVIDGMTFTSAAVLGGQPTVALLVDDDWVEVDVVGVDPISDIAVLDTPVEVLDRLWGNAVVHWTDPGRGVGLAPGSDVVVDHGSIDEEPASGLALGTVERTVASDGTPIYGAALTTARLPAGAQGAPLLGEDGTLLGLVIDTSSYLARAIPADRVVSVGRSILTSGHGDPAWIGIEGESRENGGVEIEAVDLGSPTDVSGLVAGDVIEALDGTRIVEWEHLVHLLRVAGVGSTVHIDVRLVNGDEVTIPVTIAARPDPAQS